MIGYVTIGTNDIARALAFYDALLGEIGASRKIELPTGFTLYGAARGLPGLVITPPYDKGEASPGNGNMVALVMSSREEVDRFHAKALELGASDEGAPGVRGDNGERAFYGAYFRDPDGNKICAFRMGPG